MKIRKNLEKGSATMIVIFVIFFIVIILSTFLVYVTSKRNNQLRETEKLSEIYNGDMQEIYEERKNRENRIEAEIEKEDMNKVENVTSEDGVVVPIPKGYVPSTVNGEKSVNTGFVIKEGNDGSLTEGINEFVWVPVQEISDIYDEEHKAGQLWDFSGETSTKKLYPPEKNSGYREPDVITEGQVGNDSAMGGYYDTLPSNLKEAGFDINNMNNDLNQDNKIDAKDFKINLQKEFDNMIESVKKYKGFYIGRYQTGDLSKEKAVVQKNNSDINYQNWYRMYKVNKTVGANENVETSMIWGCQWDATLRWMQTSDNPEVRKFPTDSRGKGSYWEAHAGKAIPTGSNSAYAVNNIYDMGGNVEDWTLEAHGIYLRILRGGHYNYRGNDFPASIRNHYAPIGNLDTGGTRTALYIAIGKK